MRIGRVGWVRGRRVGGEQGVRDACQSEDSQNRLQIQFHDHSLSCLVCVSSIKVSCGAEPCRAERQSIHSPGKGFLNQLFFCARRNTSGQLGLSYFCLHFSDFNFPFCFPRIPDISRFNRPKSFFNYFYPSEPGLLRGPSKILPMKIKTNDQLEFSLNQSSAPRPKVCLIRTQANGLGSCVSGPRRPPAYPMHSFFRPAFQPTTSTNARKAILVIFTHIYPYLGRMIFPRDT